MLTESEIREQLEQLVSEIRSEIESQRVACKEAEERLSDAANNRDRVSFNLDRVSHIGRIQTYRSVLHRIESILE